MSCRRNEIVKVGERTGGDGRPDKQAPIAPSLPLQGPRQGFPRSEFHGPTCDALLFSTTGRVRMSHSRILRNPGYMNRSPIQNTRAGNAWRSQVPDSVAWRHRDSGLKKEGITTRLDNAYGSVRARLITSNNSFSLDPKFQSEVQHFTKKRERTPAVDRTGGMVPLMPYLVTPADTAGPCW